MAVGHLARVAQRGFNADEGVGEEGKELGGLLELHGESPPGQDVCVGTPKSGALPGCPLARPHHDACASAMGHGAARGWGCSCPHTP